MARKMIINAIDPEEVRIAILDGSRLTDFDIETQGTEKNKGNIYIGTVMAVEPALNAAFVNYGAEKQGFLTAHDVHPHYADAANPLGKNPTIEQLLRPKQTVLVQITKDEVSTKGAVLTTYLSLAGRYLVIMPDSETQGVSRKIDDEETRQKARETAQALQVPENMGVIIRTAGKDRTKLDLHRDLRVLLRLWENIQRDAKQHRAPHLIFKEQDVIIRALRDYYSPDIDEIVLDSDEAYDRASEYMHLVMPSHHSVLTRYVERRPIFHHYRIEEQLEAIYKRQVSLPSGGSIVLDPAEALVAIDVNSGRQKSGSQEDTALQTNLEAAAEIARQLRLRDLGGIVVIDFIDMMQPRNQRKIEKALKEALTSDKARIKIGRISRNGTLELTRQRLRKTIQSSLFEVCHVCQGVGHVFTPTTQALTVVRKLRDRISRGDVKSAKIKVPSAVANQLRSQYWKHLEELEQRHQVKIEVHTDNHLRAGQDDLAFEAHPNVQPLPIEEPNFGPVPRSPEELEAIAQARREEEILAAQLAATLAQEQSPEQDDEDEDDLADELEDISPRTQSPLPGNPGESSGKRSHRPPLSSGYRSQRPRSGMQSNPPRRMGQGAKRSVSQGPQTLSPDFPEITFEFVDMQHITSQRPSPASQPQRLARSGKSSSERWRREPGRQEGPSHGRSGHKQRHQRSGHLKRTTGKISLWQKIVRWFTSLWR